jgi:hypothetical protein
VPETAIEEIDTTSRVIALSVEREGLRSPSSEGQARRSEESPTPADVA